MSAIQGFLPMVPPNVTHNDLEVHRIGGHATIGKSARLREAEAELTARLSRMAPTRPLTGAVRCEVRLCWPTNGRHRQGEPKLTKPDVDNVEKTLLDCCKRAGLIEDDRFVVDSRVSKAWADPCGVWIRFEEVVDGSK